MRYHGSRHTQDQDPLRFRQATFANIRLLRLFALVLSSSFFHAKKYPGDNWSVGQIIHLDQCSGRNDKCNRECMTILQIRSSKTQYYDAFDQRALSPYYSFEDIEYKQHQHIHQVKCLMNTKQ